MGDRILVPLDKSYGRAIKGLGEITDSVRDFAERPQNFKLVLFVGGEDVSPRLYREKDAELCHSNYDRDLYETEIYKVAKRNNIKTAGICRGAQLLNVLAGGRMMHHIENHAGCLHHVNTLKDEGSMLVNSLHHQMIVPSKKVTVVAWSKHSLSNIYLGNEDEIEIWKDIETEAIIIPSTLSCGVQWHPEVMLRDTAGYKFFYEMVKDILSMDIDGFTAEYTGKRMTAGEV